MGGTVLARYQMKRGVPASALPPGIRQDSRKHTRHVLRPTPELVRDYLAEASDEAWARFEVAYLGVLEERFAAERARFDELAAQARRSDVLLGCSCPTRSNPDLARCHTVLALRFMKERYPDLDVRLPC
jgi:uncharacterized protein YeaO (DUF488 family)